MYTAPIGAFPFEGRLRPRLREYAFSLLSRHFLRMLSQNPSSDSPDGCREKERFGAASFPYTRSLDEATWKQRLSAAFEDLYAKARELGGQVSGEHGIGVAKRPYLRETLSPEVGALMRGIKAVFDPKNILNPGKVVPGGE